MTISKNTTVAEILTEWLEMSEKRHLKPSSYDRKEITCNCQLVPFIGSKCAKALDNNDIENLIQSLLSAGYSYSTIKKAVEAIGACYRYYRIHGKLSNAPTKGVRIPNGGRNRSKNIQFYGWEELQSIQNECLREHGNGTRFYLQGDLFIILIHIGVRIGELLALTWSDVDFTHRLLHINKNAIRIKETKRVSIISKSFRTAQKRHQEYALFR